MAQVLLLGFQFTAFRNSAIVKWITITPDQNNMYKRQYY